MRIAAVDLGAASGRVMTATVGPSQLDLAEVMRFPNVPVSVGGTLHWDILRLYQGILDGLRDAGPVDSVGIDSWGVDYGLVDADGRLISNPVHYRDSRTDGVMERVLGTVAAADLYATTGLQLLPFNTVFQLVTDSLSPGQTMLLIPDLLAYWLTGAIGSERTNSSTTQLLDVRTGEWAVGLAQRLGIPAAILPPLREPGSPIGRLLPSTGLDPIPVTAVGSHDTASAVVAVPASDQRFAYISCGTWSLVGVELDGPVLTPQSRAANFTNEVGVDGTIRYLRNVMGLWLLQECQRQWGITDIAPLLSAAAQIPRGSVIDADDPVFLPPGDMPSRIADACRRTGQRVPADPPETVRCILDSLAQAHAAAVADASRLSGRAVDVVHIVGGGARNELLCRLTADACGLPVLSGPVEATALGNVLVQARALGTLHGGLQELRSLVRATQSLRRYEPGGVMSYPGRTLSP